MLAAQQLTAAQIANIKIMPVEQVIVYCRENRVQLVGQAVLPPQQQIDTSEPTYGQTEVVLQEDIVEQETFDQGALSIEQQILYGAITQDVGIEFIEIDPLALRLLQQRAPSE